MVKNGLLGIGDLVDRLSILNIKISLLEGMVKDKNVSNEKAGVAARMIRKLNKERNTIKAILNEWSGGGFEDIKVEDLGLLEQENGKRHET
jgi:hypothetical protein